MISKTMIAYDLYWLRYKKPNEQWYDLTDYIREKLIADKNTLIYDDKNKDIIFNGISIKKILNEK